MESETKVLKFKKKGVLYKIAYYDTGMGYVFYPSRSNLCNFFWRIVWKIALLCCLGFVIALVFTFLIVLSPFGLLFGLRPGLRKVDMNPFVPIQLWPKPFGVRCWPLLLMILIGVVWFFYSIRYDLLLVFSSYIFWMVIGILAILFTAFLIYSYLVQTETHQLFWAWLKAKKDKVCPLVLFVDE